MMEGKVGKDQETRSRSGGKGGKDQEARNRREGKVGKDQEASRKGEKGRVKKIMRPGEDDGREGWEGSGD